MLKQNYESTTFLGKNGTLEIRLWKNGDCTGHFEPWDCDAGESSHPLTTDGEVIKMRIVWLLRAVNNEATSKDIAVIEAAILQMSHTDWLIK